MYPESFRNQRETQRTSLSFPIQISRGTQITLTGQLKDLSLKSAFIKIKTNIYLQNNDEISFAIQCVPAKPEESVQGVARISRIAAGEGIAIYFTEMDPNSSSRLKGLLNLNAA